MNFSTAVNYLDNSHLFLNLARIARILETGLALDDARHQLTNSERHLVEKTNLVISQNIRRVLRRTHLAEALNKRECLGALRCLFERFGESLVLPPD